MQVMTKSLLSSRGDSVQSKRTDVSCWGGEGGCMAGAPRGAEHSPPLVSPLQKLFRLPGGPTLTFKVMQYSLIKDVVSSLKRHRMHEQQFTHPPLLVLSNFGLQQIQLKLMATMFQNMFPSINVHRVNLNTIKRCLLISYDAETELLNFRHYSVKVVPVGVSKGLKKLLQEKFPNMSRLEDISELLVKDINLSESEAEQDGTHNVLELPQAYAGRGNMKAQQSAVRLTEVDPRMTLQLVKVEEGLAQGNVLYHSFVHKTESEVKEILARKEAKLQLKAERRRKQEGDVERKRPAARGAQVGAARAAVGGRRWAARRGAERRGCRREKSLAGIRRKRQQEGDSDAEDPGAPEQQDAAEQSEESDAEYYRQEVGEEPDKGGICSPTAPRGSETPRALPGRGNGAGGTTRKSILPAPAPHPTALGKRRKGGSAPGKRGSAPGKRRKEDSAPGKRRKGNPAPGKQQRGDSAPGKRQKGDSAPRKRWKGNPTPGKQQQGDSAPKDLRHHGRIVSSHCAPHREPPPKHPPPKKQTTKKPQSNNLGGLQEEPPEMTAHLGPCGNFSSFQESVWSVLVVQFLLALAGNGAAVYHFVSRRRSWHSGVVYSFHLALSGLLYSLTLPFLAAYYYPPKDWRYGAVLCKLERFLFHCNLYGSIFFVACISLNRYLGIVHPLRVHGRLRPRHAKALSAGVWVLAGVLSAPTLYFAELEEAEGVRKCLGSAALWRLRWFYPYSLLLAALGCALPFLLTAFCHAAVLRTVLHNPHLSQVEKRKVGLLVGAGVALYAFSYLPYHVFRNLNLWRRLLPPAAENCAVSSAIHATAQVCKILVNLNVCLHPLLYAALADTLQSCCSTGGTDEERAERVELRPAAPQPPPGSPRQLVQPVGGL
ncbi:LOW QUALITY PROTEIN: uncharacterized protein LOC130143270 [Falco biarmicus]|uniref:LOW QUALITY PROTEIN: uncharacterized protein LOC130143270 n=1 Tax=Falco biarmicus TaxID=345155 RepID=UPI0024BC214A|nr:LOW QUALITY PROTEIN: uncharacterized protein LOC130143270 [Falco biarmicus]